MNERMQLASPDLNCLLDQNLFIFSVFISSLSVFYLLISLRKQRKSTECACGCHQSSKCRLRAVFQAGLNPGTRLWATVQGREVPGRGWLVAGAVCGAGGVRSCGHTAPSLYNPAALSLPLGPSHPFLQPLGRGQHWSSEALLWKSKT